MGGLDLIAEFCDLLPFAWGGSFRHEQVMRKIAAIAIRDGCENVPAVARTFQNNLCDSGKVFTDRVRILGIRRTELVEIDLLTPSSPRSTLIASSPAIEKEVGMYSKLNF